MIPNNTNSIILNLYNTCSFTWWKRSSKCCSGGVRPHMRLSTYCTRAQCSGLVVVSLLDHPAVLNISRAAFTCLENCTVPGLNWVGHITPKVYFLTLYDFSSAFVETRTDFCLISIFILILSCVQVRAHAHPLTLPPMDPLLLWLCMVGSSWRSWDGMLTGFGEQVHHRTHEQPNFLSITHDVNMHSSTAESKCFQLPTRPSCSGSREHINRFSGGEPVTHIHPDLERGSEGKGGRRRRVPLPIQCFQMAQRKVGEGKGLGSQIVECAPPLSLIISRKGKQQIEKRWMKGGFAGVLAHEKHAYLVPV